MYRLNAIYIYIYIYIIFIFIFMNIVKKLIFSWKLFQKMKLSYILDSWRKVKHFKSFFVLILMIRAYSSWKSKIQYLKILEYLHLSFNKWPSYSINCGYLLFFETTIMGNCCSAITADLAMVQKTIIDTLHKEGKSQRVITKRGGCSMSAVSKHIKWKVDYKEKLGREMCTSIRDDRKLENTVKQIWFKHLGELHKLWTEAGVNASRVTTLRCLREKGYQATSETETTSEAPYLA